jgi:hypothetical protein
MKSSTEIVHGGGWVIHRTIAKPRASILTLLSLIWIGVALPASVPFQNGVPAPFSWLEWLCISLMAMEPLLIALALLFWLVEPWRTFTVRRANPDYDMRRLY